MQNNIFELVAKITLEGHADQALELLSAVQPTEAIEKDMLGLSWKARRKLRKQKRYLAYKYGWKGNFLTVTPEELKRYNVPDEIIPGILDIADKVREATRLYMKKHKEIPVFIPPVIPEEEAAPQMREPAFEPRKFEPQRDVQAPTTRKVLNIPFLQKLTPETRRQTQKFYERLITQRDIPRTVNYLTNKHNNNKERAKAIFLATLALYLNDTITANEIRQVIKLNKKLHSANFVLETLDELEVKYHSTEAKNKIRQLRIWV